MRITWTRKCPAPRASAARLVCGLQNAPQSATSVSQLRVRARRSLAQQDYGKRYGGRYGSLLP
eukprot:5743224-Prymnesium_polylepis.2